MTTTTPVRAVTRAIDLLMALTDGPQTLRAVCEAADLSKGTGHRILAGLAHRGLVIQDPNTGHYMLGPACFRIVTAIGRGLGGLGPIARPVLERLREETEETVTLHVRMGDRRICVEELPSPHPIRYTAGVGIAEPVHIGSAGKALLAFADKKDVDAVLDSLDAAPRKEWGRRDRKSLEQELVDIHARGWAESHGERVPGATAVSAPITDGTSRLVAVLSVLGPDSRIPPEHVSTLGQAAVDAADDIGKRLASMDIDT